MPLSSIWRDLLFLLKISRPLSTWPSGILLFLLGFYVSGAQLDFHVLLSVPALFLLPIVIFGLNDVYDYNADKISGRKNSLLEGKLLPREKQSFVKKEAFAAAMIVMAFSIATWNITNITATSVGILLAYAYSVPPVRLKERPILDSLSNWLGVLIVLLMGFSYGGSLRDFPPKLLLASLGGASLHAMGAVMDYTPDRQAGLSTIATFFGKCFAAAFSAAIALFILLFSGIRSVFLDILIWLWICMAIFTVARPEERLVRRFILLSFPLTLLLVGAFLYQQFYK